MHATEHPPAGQRTVHLLLPWQTTVATDAIVRSRVLLPVQVTVLP